MDIDIKEYKSHSEKLLQDHLNGVVAKVRKRTENLPSTLNLKLAEVAALFHDVGKLNPNFQRKLLGEKNVGYSSHAYLSAFTWFRFCSENKSLVVEWLGERNETRQRFISVGTMISKHHGNLPDFSQGSENGFTGGVFNRSKKRIKSPADELSDFLEKYSGLPVSNFLQLLLPHKPFLLDCSQDEKDKILKLKQDITKRGEEIDCPLDFFLETQFCFACLLEADKRDASDNTNYNREVLQKDYFEANFALRLEEKLESFAAKENKSLLDNLRTEMREQSIINLHENLSDNQRVFTLTAPTGAGKTMMLLALANEILRKDSSLSVIYTLPFLSITEQVENECHKIFNDNEKAVLRIDSRAENKTIQELQEKLDDEQTDENVKRLIQESFTETTFDHPFIITTFQQVFETLLSNRNATLLRLPNFSKTIFLIDEIQALPYRLYSFFTALLEEFCKQFDSFAIISTATMPHLDFPSNEIEGKNLFVNYQKPKELLDAPKYFSEKVFNRYRVNPITQDDFQVGDLAEFMESRDESCLIILNTIDDTKDLYSLLSEFYSSDECVLLNTHFTLEDRRTKIEYCKNRLEANEKVILISTQLIEAGVDIDFPIVFRDFCPLPSLIQSAGRCNRNGKLEFGKVFFFALQKESGKLSSELIYREEAKEFLRFCKRELSKSVTESELFEIQLRFFQVEIGENLKFGLHKQSIYKPTGEIDLVKAINKASFEQLGKFRLIDEQIFGTEFRYYIPHDFDDEEFENLFKLSEIKFSKTFEDAKQKQIKIENQLKKMSSRIVSFRLPIGKEDYAPASDNIEVCRIRKLGNLSDYTFERGINLRLKSGCLI